MKYTFTTKEKVDAFKKGADIVRALLKEMRELSKKKPDGTLSKFQVKTINRALGGAQDVFHDDEKLEYLDLLEDEQLPTNADAVLVMTQYETALQSFEDEHFGYSASLGETGWHVHEQVDEK